MQKQVCPKCNIIRLSTDFGIRRLDIPYKTCIDCRERGKKYYEEHRDSYKKYHKDYYYKNYEKHQERNKKNNPKYKQLRIEWAKKNREYIREKERSSLKRLAQNKINNSMRTDIKHGRNFDISEYITRRWIENNLVFQDFKCYYCHNILLLQNFEIYDQKQWSIDRIDNSIPHIQSNCNICCLKCNLQRNKNKLDVFLKSLHKN